MNALSVSTLTRVWQSRDRKMHRHAFKVEPKRLADVLDVGVGEGLRKERVSAGPSGKPMLRSQDRE